MKNKSTKLVDDKKYWKSRHKNLGDIRASGVKSASLRSSKYIYKILDEQYLDLLQNALHIPPKFSVIDCGFGDGYFLRFFEENFPKANINGVDISDAALEKINFIPKNNLHISELQNFKTQKQFDIVHCFDVLYHILDDDDYANSIESLCNLSSNYVILHERFLDKLPIYSSSHVRFRERMYTIQLMNKHGFYLYKKIPTHFVAVRMYLYKLTSLFPRLFYTLDKYISRTHPSFQERIATHHIYVFAKNKT